MMQFTTLTLFHFMHHFRDLDIAILKVIYENRNPVFDSAFIVITDSAPTLAFGIPGILLIFALIKKNIVLRRNSLLIVISVALSAIVSNILKYTIDLPRPYEIYPFIEKLSTGGSPTFPSGHTADAFAFALALSLVYPKLYFIFPVFIWAALVGYSRMSLGVHFPSDVLAGAIIGVTCALLTFYIQRKNRVKQF